MISLTTATLDSVKIADKRFAGAVAEAGGQAAIGVITAEMTRMNDVIVVNHGKLLPHEIKEPQ